MQIFLADLFNVCQAGRNTRTNPYTVPLAIGFLASTLKVRMPGCTVRLFRDPDKLLYALKATQPDLLGFSICSWNLDLSPASVRSCQDPLPANPSSRRWPLRRRRRRSANRELRRVSGPRLPRAERGRERYRRTHRGHREEYSSRFLDPRRCLSQRRRRRWCAGPTSVPPSPTMPAASGCRRSRYARRARAR